jgi:hypothetical protein
MDTYRLKAIIEYLEEKKDDGWIQLKEIELHFNNSNDPHISRNTLIKYIGSLVDDNYIVVKEKNGRRIGYKVNINLPYPNTERQKRWKLLDEKFRINTNDHLDEMHKTYPLYHELHRNAIRIDLNCKNMFYMTQNHHNLLYQYVESLIWECLIANPDIWHDLENEDSHKININISVDFSKIDDFLEKFNEFKKLARDKGKIPGPPTFIIKRETSNPVQIFLGNFFKAFGIEKIPATYFKENLHSLIYDGYDRWIKDENGEYLVDGNDIGIFELGEPEERSDYPDIIGKSDIDLHAIAKYEDDLLRENGEKWKEYKERSKKEHFRKFRIEDVKKIKKRYENIIRKTEMGIETNPPVDPKVVIEKAREVLDRLERGEEICDWHKEVFGRGDESDK